MTKTCRAFLLCAALCIAGCAANTVSITVASDIPTPVTERLPLKVGVYYDEQFANHVYEEDSEDRPDWKIESGASQTALFDEILSSMFTTLEKVPAMPPGAEQAGLDIVIAPKVEEMQFSTPTETKTDFYEAWIRYEMSIYEPAGPLITAWRFEGYGRSSIGLLINVDKGMNEAINVALRDAGAKMVVKFKDIPELKGLMHRD